MYAVCCLWVGVCLCVSYLSAYIYTCTLAWHCVYTCSWYAAPVCTTVRSHIEILLSLRNCIFFLSLQLRETNGHVMQQWKALNAKHIIREEGCGEEYEAGRQKHWSGIEQERGRYSNKVTKWGLETDRWTYLEKRSEMERNSRLVTLRKGEWERKIVLSVAGDPQALETFCSFLLNERQRFILSL